MIKVYITVLFIIIIDVSIKAALDPGVRSQKECTSYSTTVPKIFYPFINLEGYIVNGEFPHLAVIYIRSLYHTGLIPVALGSLISNKFVISIGEPTDPSYFTEKVRLGSTANPYNLESGKLCDVAKVIQHPDYNDSNPEKGNSYLSLIELNQTVEFSYNIRPACLFSNVTLPDIKISSISCTKNRRHKKILIKSFRTVEYYLTPTTECERVYKNTTVIADRFPKGMGESVICADYKGSSYCGGNAGSPLQFIDPSNGMYTVIGISHFGDRRCRGIFPAGFINATFFLNWIEDIVWPDFMPDVRIQTNQNN